jgi:hypothetical protein
MFGVLIFAAKATYVRVTHVIGDDDDDIRFLVIRMSRGRGDER